jgi:hypothetical protein
LFNRSIEGYILTRSYHFDPPILLECNLVWHVIGFGRRRTSSSDHQFIKRQRDNIPSVSSFKHFVFFRYPAVIANGATYYLLPSLVIANREQGHVDLAV